MEVTATMPILPAAAVDQSALIRPIPKQAPRILWDDGLGVI
jgi:hypothetical protein